MTSPIAFPSDWHPCKGCACLNHGIPSYRFSIIDADSPIADHPDLGKLTRSNNAPTPPEEKTLQGMISDSGKRIDAIDVHVLELNVMKQELLQSIICVDKELAKLDKERQRLFDSVRERRLLLGALRRMPKEVLAHIFFHTLVFPFPRVQPSGTLANLGDWSTFSASRHPLLSFELVSHNWKDVLDTFSNLWSYVNILIDRIPSATYTRYIGNQLSRSRLSPLSVSICHSDSASVTRLGAFPVAILMALFSVNRRVQTLHLCLPGRYFPSMQQLHLSFPTLQEFVLLSSSETSEVAQHLHFGPLPNLQVFHATDVSNIDRLSLPWHQITHFTNMHEVAGRGLPASRALNVLKMMSRVSVCRLSLDLLSLVTGVVEQTTLSKLHTLTLSSVYQRSFDSSSTILSVLNSFILPALLDLSVACLLGSRNSMDLAGTFTSIRQLIERSHSPLTSLYFDNGVIIIDDLIYILSNTPTLQDLRLTNTRGITDAVLNLLARKGVDTESDSQVPVVVPHLHTLHISDYLTFHGEVYVQMVESRWTCHPRHLKSVNLCQFLGIMTNEGADREAASTLALSRLYALRSEGLDVVVSTR
ncbi:hypothetical protein ARMGADRAFT_496768 [Armillaria gallica]|uniref:F-box domain-containing protein n=1 Tax=Armillaria gallica TaxID=47427 RepID=A0A2H3EJ92_ARMGA|nr:hypothetical protein ARMGADRAFT_496768 [Armillaria gallica]